MYRRVCFGPSIDQTSNRSRLSTLNEEDQREGGQVWPANRSSACGAEVGDEDDERPRLGQQHAKDDSAQDRDDGPMTQRSSVKDRTLREPDIRDLFFVPPEIMSQFVEVGNLNFAEKHGPLVLCCSSQGI